MSVHLTNGRLKLSITKSSASKTSRSLNVYVTRDVYENLGSPPWGALVIEPLNTASGVGNQTHLQVRFDTEVSERERVRWQKVGGKDAHMVLQTNVSRLNFPIPSFFFRSTEFPATFSRDAHRVVVQTPVSKVWKMAEEKRRTKSFARRKNGHEQAVPVIKSKSASEQIVHPTSEQLVNGALSSVVADFNRGLTALRQLGVPFKVEVEGDRVSVNIAGINLS